MIKKKKNVEPKEKNNNKPLIETKQKINITEKNQPCKSDIIPLKRIKTSTIVKKRFNKNSKIHNSISSKEEIKKKTSPNNIRNRQNNQNLGNNNTNSNKLFSSNNLFSTRDTDSISKENDQKFKNYYIKNYSNFHKTNLTKGNDIFKKNFLKQTIIIDNEGNNNLNLNLNNMGINDYKNILNENKNKNEIFNDNIDTSNSLNLFCNTDANSLFESSNYTNNSLSKINKLNDMKQTDIDKNEEEKRIKEYNKIFNLLNTNIEQFKKMFINNMDNIHKDKNKKIIIKKKGNNITKTIPTDNISYRKYKINNNHKEKNYELNFKKNLSEENLRSSSNKYNNNILDINAKTDNFEIYSNNDIKKNDNNKNNNELKNNISFLESSIDNDFYQALINQTFLQNLTRSTLDINTDNISNEKLEKKALTIKSLTEGNKGIYNNKYDKNQAKIDINANKENLKNSQNNSINTKLLIKNKTLEKLNRKQIEDDNQNDYQSYINEIDKKNCIIF